MSSWDKLEFLLLLESNILNANISLSLILATLQFLLIIKFGLYFKLYTLLNNLYIRPELGWLFFCFTSYFFKGVLPISSDLTCPFISWFKIWFSSVSWEYSLQFTADLYSAVFLIIELISWLLNKYRLGLVLFFNFVKLGISFILNCIFLNLVMFLRFILLRSLIEDYLHLSVSTYVFFLWADYYCSCCCLA
jgi:hypothetical protein